MLWLAGARLQVEPLPSLDWSRPSIFVMNHPPVLDVCCAFAALPRTLRFVAKHTAAHVPCLGWYTWTTGMVFIHRGNRRQAVESLRRAGAAIRAGKSILVYPEGTRSHAPFALLPFKAGLFALALAVEAQVQRVPVAVEVSGRVKVGTPHSTKGMQDRDVLMEEAHRALSALHRELGGAG